MLGAQHARDWTQLCLKTIRLESCEPDYPGLIQQCARIQCGWTIDFFWRLLLYEPKVVGLAGLQSDLLQTQLRPIACVLCTQHSSSDKSRLRDERIRVFFSIQGWGTLRPNSTMSLATQNRFTNTVARERSMPTVESHSPLKVSRESTRMAQRHINTKTGECPGKISRRTVRSN